MKPSRLACVALVAVILSSAAQAQEAIVITTVEAVAPPVQQTGPRMDAIRAGIAIAPAASAERLTPAPMYRKANVRGRNLMIIGGAAILGGAIVGGEAGNLVALGGLGVGLYGLYIYLN